MPGLTESLIGMLAGVPRLNGALCRGHAPAWDEDPEDPAAERFAISQCRVCPALAACGDWLESLPLSQRPHGITAGIVRREPKSRRRRASAARVEEPGVEEPGVVAS